jgi:hypothetical protein
VPTDSESIRHNRFKSTLTTYNIQKTSPNAPLSRGGARQNYHRPETIQELPKIIKNADDYQHQKAANRKASPEALNIMKQNMKAN